MRIAYLDCFSGISGDMFLGALIGAGVPASVFEDVVTALNIGARLEISRVDRSGITATKVDVLVHGEKELPREEFWDRQSQQVDAGERGHDHAHAHSKDHNHQHDHQHSDSRGVSTHSHGRGLSEIKKIISEAKLTTRTKTAAISIFEALGGAESHIHNVPIDSIHFHEVGAVDAMVDVVCAAAGIEALSVEELLCSPLNVGGGTVTCAHGTFPVPAPATLELLKEAPVYSSRLKFELVTPTGAAIVKTLASRFEPFPSMTVEKVGYGAGTRDLRGQANVARLTIGEAQVATNVSEETITILEANLDDLNPQVFGYVVDRLFEQGALDVFGVPVQMKKNRPGTLLKVLCNSDAADRLTALIFCETTTLGVRRRIEQRRCLNRTWQTVQTRWGDVRMKIGSMNGRITNYAPEYEDCRRIAVEHEVPLKTVMQEAVQQYLSLEFRSTDQSLARTANKGEQR
jgi:pyridinium-3,5-bisthiocarboxylic acid mononucleotide nickel chelatase